MGTDNEHPESMEDPRPDCFFRRGNILFICYETSETIEVRSPSGRYLDIHLVPTGAEPFSVRAAKRVEEAVAAHRAAQEDQPQD